MRRFGAMVLMTVLLHGGCTLAEEDDPVGTRRDVVERINAARARARTCGDQAFPAAEPVAWNAELAAAALRHSADMSANGLGGHIGSDGSGPERRIRDAGYRAAAYGEIVAVGSESLNDVIKAWLESPGHCSIMMNSTFTEAGAAIAGGRFWTVDFARSGE